MTREEEINERLDKTTKGKWRPEETYIFNHSQMIADMDDGVSIARARGVGSGMTIEEQENNINFLGHAKSDIEYLLKQNALLEKKLTLCIEQRNSRISTSDWMMMQRDSYDKQLEELASINFA